MNHTNELTDTDELLLEELKKRLKEKTRLLESQTLLLIEMGEMNRKLRDAEQVKSSFLSNIRNEINNPVTSITGLSNQLMTGTELSNETTRRLASLINKEIFTLDFQLRNIFAAAEIEAGDVHPQAAQVNVAELIKFQIDYFNPKSSQQEITISHLHLSAQKTFRTDAYILQVVLMNILSNAITFSNAKGKVDIESKIENNILSLKIQDFGKGIDENDLKHLFERFKQVESGTTKSHLGHGLGLSIVKDFVDTLHGDLKITSEKGQTTIIGITIPELPDTLLAEGFSSGNDILFTDAELF